MRAGFIEVDITPPPGLRLGGYMHRLGLPARGAKDPLYARLLKLDQGGESVVIVQLDLLGLYREQADHIGRVASEASGSDRYVVATTHTHSAPETIIPMWPNTLPYSEDEVKLFNEWFSSLVERVEKAAGEIAVERVESMCVASTRIDGLCYNRAFPNEGYDSETPVLLITTSSDKILVYSTPCHPVCNVDYYYSADYHAFITSNLRSRGFKPIALTGPTGDVDPVKKGYDYAEYMGREISRRILESISTCKPIEPSIALAEREVEVSLRAINYEEALRKFKVAYESYYELFIEARRKGYIDPEHFEMLVELLYADQELEVAKIGSRSRKTVLKVLRVGSGVYLVGFPGEMVSFTSSSLKDSLRGGSLLISTYTNDYIGYVPTERFYDTNKYEARTAQWSIVSKGVERVLREEIIDLIKSLA